MEDDDKYNGLILPDKLLFSSGDGTLYFIDSDPGTVLREAAEYFNKSEVENVEWPTNTDPVEAIDWQLDD